MQGGPEEGSSLSFLLPAGQGHTRIASCDLLGHGILKCCGTPTCLLGAVSPIVLLNKGQAVWLLVTQSGDSESMLPLDFIGQCSHGRARLQEFCLSKRKVSSVWAR